MMQGDSYRIPLEITTDSGVADAESFSDIEVFIGRIRKLMSDGEIDYDADKKKFMVHVKQDETFFLQPGKRKVQVRVKLRSGDVIGVDAGEINIVDAISKVVL